MTKKQYQRYSPELKIHVLKPASEDGVTGKNVCEEPGVDRAVLIRRLVFNDTVMDVAENQHYGYVSQIDGHLLISQQSSWSRLHTLSVLG